MGEHTPFDAPIDDIKDGIDHRPHLQHAVPPTRLGWRDQMFDTIPFGISKVCRVWFRGHSHSLPNWCHPGTTFQTASEVYGWFTEGFDTADLQEARALLAVLADNAVAQPCGFRRARCPGVAQFVESDLPSVGLNQVPYYPYSAAPPALSRPA